MQIKVFTVLGSPWQQHVEARPDGEAFPKETQTHQVMYDEKPVGDMQENDFTTHDLGTLPEKPTAEEIAGLVRKAMSLAVELSRQERIGDLAGMC